MPHVEGADDVAVSLFDALFRITSGGNIVANLAAEVTTIRVDHRFHRAQPDAGRSPVAIRARLRPRPLIERGEHRGQVCQNDIHTCDANRLSIDDNGDRDRREKTPFI